MKYSNIRSTYMIESLVGSQMVQLVKSAFQEGCGCGCDALLAPLSAILTQSKSEIKCKIVALIHDRSSPNSSHVNQNDLDVREKIICMHAFRIFDVLFCKITCTYVSCSDIMFLYTFTWVNTEFQLGALIKVYK